MVDSRSYLRSALRGFATALSFIAFNALITFIIILSASSLPLFKNIDQFIICLFPSILSPFVLNSFVLAYAYGDKEYYEEFILRDDKTVTLRRELSCVFKTPTLLTEFLITSFIVLIAALLGAFYSFTGMFPSGFSVGTWLPALILTPLCFCFSIFSRYETARYYKKLDKSKELVNFNPKISFIKRTVLILVIYIIAAPVVPFTGFIFFSVFRIFAMFSEALSVIGLIAAILVLILLIWGIKVLLCVLHRRKFVKRLIQCAKDNGYLLKNVETPYRSFATSKEQFTFTLKIKDKEYDCIVISTLWKGTPLVFTSSADAYFMHRLGTDKHNTTIRHNIEFCHKGSGEKIIIVDPEPKAVFAEEDEVRKKISCSEKIWGAAIYNAESFLGCAERDCL